MARTVAPLTDSKIKSAKPNIVDGKYKGYTMRVKPIVVIMIL